MSQQLKTKSKSTASAPVAAVAAVAAAPVAAPVAAVAAPVDLSTSTPSVELSAAPSTPVVKKEKKEKKVVEAVVAAPTPVLTSAPAATIVATPVLTPATASVEKKEKVAKVSKKAEASTTASATSVAVSSPVATESSAPAEESASASAQVGELEASIAAQSVEFMTKINMIGSMFASLKTEFRSLEKKWSRELKTAQKSCSKKRKRAGNRAPSGFVKPTRISDELASFLGKDKGTEMARTDVTREINMYIRSNNLQDKDNGRKINPDTKLQALLKLATTDELTYFNLQKYMSPHFQKAADAAAALLSSA